MFAGVTLPGWVRALFPLLPPKYVAERTLDGVQKDKEVVVIPSIFWYRYNPTQHTHSPPVPRRLVLLLRFVLPVFVFDGLSRVLGGMDGMRTFKGHAGTLAEAEKKSTDSRQKED